MSNTGWNRSLGTSKREQGIVTQRRKGGEPRFQLKKAVIDSLPALTLKNFIVKENFFKFRRR